MRFLSCALILLGISIYSADLQAQKQIPDSVILEQAVILSTSKEILPAESKNREILIIQAAELQAMNISSVDEALRFLAGIDIQQRGGFGVQADISARGATFNQTLVLLDGVRLNDPLTGHFSGYFPIPLAEIAKIEIIKGASSGMYGTEAVGAVIQIISKGYVSKQDSSIDISTSVMAGSNSSIFSDSYVQYNRKLWSIGIGASTKSSDGHTPENDSIPYDFSLNTYSFNAQLHPNSSLKAGVRLALDERDFGARYFYTRSTADLSREIVDRIAAQAYVRKEINSKLAAELHGGWMSTDDDFLFNPAFPGNFHTTQQIDIHANTYWQFKPHLSYTFGAQSILRNVESSDRGNHEVAQYGLYAAQQWILNSWVWQLSARMEYHDSFGWEMVPQSSLGKSFGKWNVSAFLGRAIRAADITELYVSNNLNAVSSGRNLGNPLLNAESSWNSELNITRDISPALQAEASFFYRAGNDLIDYVLTPATSIPNATNIDPEGSYFYASNVSSLETYGLDFQMNGNVKTESAGNFRYQFGALIVLHSDSVESKYIAGNQGLLLNGSLQWQFGRLKANLNGLYKDRDSDAAGSISRELPSSYFLLDGGLNIEIYKGLAASMSCRNLFDRKYADVLGAQMPGRWFMLGLRFNLQ